MQNTQAAMDHLKTHQTYPATKTQLIAACSGLTDFSEDDKKEFEGRLQDKTYNSAEEVMAVVGLQAAA